MNETYHAQIAMRTTELDGEHLYYARKKLYFQLMHKIVGDLPFETGFYIRISDFYTKPTWRNELEIVCIKATVRSVYDVPVNMYTFEPPPYPAKSKLEQAVNGAAGWLADEVLKRLLI